MGSVSALARAVKRSMVAGWHTDVTDRAQMARLRSRILVLTSAAGVVAGAASIPTGSGYAGHARAMLITLAGLLAQMTHAAIRRHRMTDREFVAVLIANQSFAAVMIHVVEVGGRTSMTALAFMPSVVFGAIFHTHRRHLVVQLLGGATTLAVVDLGEPLTPTGRSGLIVGIAILALVAFVVRLQHEQTAAALGRSRHGEVTDPLTGLVNRRGLERTAEQDWTERARAGRQVAVLAVDVDHFKSVNDAHGHAAGDQVLRRLAEVLSANLRTGDVAARIGGEEFLVLCEVEPSRADQIAERLRAAVERELAPITVSIGVHLASPQPGETGAQALWTAAAAADRALYQAKRTGRNKVVLLDT